MMPQVDFYILPEDNSLSPLLYTVRLVEKAFRLGHRLYVHTTDAAQTEALSELAEVAKLPNANAEVQFHAKLAEGRSRELDSKDADAEAAYREAIRLAPNHVEGHMLLGAMLHRLGKDGVPASVAESASPPETSKRALPQWPAKSAPVAREVHFKRVPRAGVSEMLPRLSSGEGPLRAMLDRRTLSA